MPLWNWPKWPEFWGIENIPLSNDKEKKDNIDYTKQDYERLEWQLKKVTKK